MTIKEIIKEAIDKMNSNKIKDSRIIARRILSMVLNKDNQYLIVNDNKSIDNGKYIEFSKLINQIIEGTPLQYITHNQEFMGYDFYVDENVLIPQPDTEIIVENVIDIYNNIKDKSNINILDLCTGSGAIAISLDKILNKSDNINIYASDISDKALSIANKNNSLQMSDVKFIKSDMFENIDQKFNIIVSNPPYIETQTICNLSKNVKKEPYIALDGGKDGLKYYSIILENASNYLKENGYICLEIGFNQAEKVVNIIKAQNKYEDIRIQKDLSDNNRCIICKLKK